MHALVILNGVTALLAGLGIWTMPNDAAVAASGPGYSRSLAREGWRLIARTPWLVAWAGAAAIGFRLVGINLMFLDLPLWVNAGWHGVWLGLGVTILYAAGWASLLVPRVQARLGSRLTLTLSQVLTGGLVLVLPLLRSPWALTGFMAGAVAFQSWQAPVVNSVLTRTVPESIRVTTHSLLDLPSLLVTIVCELGVGMLADRSLAWALWASGGAVVATVPLWWVPRPPYAQAAPIAP